jgi:hypothetical protein
MSGIFQIAFRPLGGDGCEHQLPARYMVRNLLQSDPPAVVISWPPMIISVPCFVVGLLF